MCGIIGIVGQDTVADRLIEGLKRLEYRGYDSSGIAVLKDSKLLRSRAKGKIIALQSRLQSHPIDGNIGIAHTRWATHGAPTENNAHPHFAGTVGVVHNGIIENFTALRESFKGQREFVTETDTEVVAHLIDHEITLGAEPIEAFRKTLKKLSGAFALGIIIDGLDGHIYAARRGSPLAIGLGDGENYIGSDAIALASLSRDIIYLEEGDWAVITQHKIDIFDADDNPVVRPVTHTSGSLAAAKKGNYRHYMLKEIHEQPETVGHALTHYIDAFNHQAVSLEGLDFKDVSRLTIIACGTASYAGHVAKYWFEQIAELPCEIDIASEFRYRRPALDTKGMALAVSQSGETADTLAALRYCQSKGLKTGALVNVMTSTMAREADVALPINAGPEIGVASTKAFTAQLTSLLALSILAARQRGVIDEAREVELCSELTQVPRLVSEALLLDEDIQVLAQDLSKATSAFYLGRGALFPLALEGALKLKEISYIHAEGYAAGELKHGPIALIEEGTPVIVLAPHDELFEKTISNMQEVASRGARVILITDPEGALAAGHMADSVLISPACAMQTAPIVLSVAIQLLAYHTAVLLGTDVDQPRNLAKSVTVE
ncbi:glutamine--fructose-6-phosphate transaminase (isomerizing) [Robiginitomaculum antarcticum]|uniref:glutamine--fructose-6-phosphate transaminase (isomerizing) n=1 Tax=Robiginitomaculum antarcticum TaxID=437507 RepID=UPI00037D8822|nr:glutamine--fructose-6-phosphate transaminase (isomerizing) [Robiginitomaculum antarcticum]